MDEGNEGGDSIVIVAALAVCARRAQKEKGEGGRGGAAQFPWELQQMLPLHGLNETFTCQQRQKRPEQQFNP